MFCAFGVRRNHFVGLEGSWEHDGLFMDLGILLWTTQIQRSRSSEGKLLMQAALLGTV